ncbi:hypothetical protein NQ318_010569 [Aromia moschata]|uniref:RNase H type-1 domain-containing protein n=1 Tax=Aromia moschata TaxID=1265417 RepID=A0AAV8X391_9CUCU|nr:hypothetical protein NQ318_010569 [Aromia moschata]
MEKEKQDKEFKKLENIEKRENREKTTIQQRRKKFITKKKIQNRVPCWVRFSLLINGGFMQKFLVIRIRILERLQAENAAEWGKRERLETEKLSMERDNKKLRSELRDMQERLERKGRPVTNSDAEIRHLQQELTDKNKPYGRVEEPWCTWGLRPRILHWMYTAIVRPVITYGAIAWWPGTRTDKARKQLDKVQRLACLGITSAMRTAPSRAIEVLTGLLPLHLVIEHEAMRSAYRLTGLGHWIGEEQTTGHTTMWNKATKNCPVLLMLQDSVEPTICPSPKLGIQIPSRDDWDNTNNTICQNGLIWFTDGSKIGDKAGAGDKNYLLPSGHMLAFSRAEIYAILACGLEILKTAPKRRTIQICTDSQAALMAIESSKVKSRLVLDCKKILNDLASCNRVILT